MISAFLTRRLPPPFPKGKTKSDPQRSHFYLMEREFMGVCVYHNVSRSNLQVVADHACQYYRVSPIRVTVYNDSDDRTMGEFARSEHYNGQITNRRIRLNRGYFGNNVGTLLHELTHYFIEEIYFDIQPHGAQFVGIYMHLLDKYRIMPSCAFRALAKKCRVKIAGKFKPGAIRG